MGKKSFLTGSQASQANLWQWNHVRCAWLCYSFFFSLLTCPKQSLFKFFTQLWRCNLGLKARFNMLKKSKSVWNCFNWVSMLPKVMVSLLYEHVEGILIFASSHRWWAALNTVNHYRLLMAISRVSAIASTASLELLGVCWCTLPENIAKETLKMEM